MTTISIPADSQGLRRGRTTLANGWTVSIVSGPKGFGVAGVDGETWEVAVLKPSGGMLDDILAHQTAAQVESIMRLVAMM